MTTLAALKTAIKNKIEALSEIAVVFDYPEGDFKKFPAAVVTVTGGVGQVLDTHKNERTFNFMVRLYQEQSEAATDKASADQIMTAAADALLIAFDQDKDLGGASEIIRVVDFDLDFKQQPGTWNFATFKINVLVIVPSWPQP